MQLIVCLFVSLFIVSCEKELLTNEVNPSNLTKNERIVFKTTSQLLDTYFSLCQFNEIEKKKWIDSVDVEKPFLSYFKECKDSSLLETPIAWQMLFNNDLEVQIGDTIAKYKNGKIVAESIKGELLLEKYIMAQISIGHIPVTNSNSISSRTVVTGNWAGNVGNTVWMGTRYIPVELYSGWQHRYVHEFRTIMIEASGNIVQQLFFDIKFHYKKNQGWREATGENRHVYIKNFRITVAGIQGGGVLWDKSFSTQGKIELPVCWISMLKAEDFNRKWSIECTGTIEHSVDGFPNTKRVDIW